VPTAKAVTNDALDRQVFFYPSFLTVLLVL